MRQVPISELSREWPRVRGWLSQALEESLGDEDEWDVYLALSREVYTLWLAERFAAVTQTVKYPKQSVFTVLYCGGSDAGAEALRGAFEFAKQIASKSGIETVRVYGRRGWLRLLGVKEAGVILQVQV